jgi:hypothetical protein
MEIMRIYWPEQLKEELTQNSLHSVFMLEPFSMPSLSETVQIILIGSNKIYNFGTAEIVSTKECRIKDIEEKDYLRQKKGYKTTKEVVETLKKTFPEYQGSINLQTPIKVITIRRLNYDLKGLNRYFTRKSLSTSAEGSKENTSQIMKPRKE